MQCVPDRGCFSFVGQLLVRAIAHAKLGGGSSVFSIPQIYASARRRMASIRHPNCGSGMENLRIRGLSEANVIHDGRRPTEQALCRCTAA